MSKKLKGQVRISDAEKAFMDNQQMGFTQVFRTGLNTLRLSIQPQAPLSCVYLYITRQNPAPPASAPCSSSEPPAHHCCCPACPIRSAFPQVPHHQKPGQKEDELSDPGTAALSDLQKSSDPAIR